MNRRITFAALALTSGLTLSACGNGADEASTATAPPASSSSEPADHTPAGPDAHQHPADGGPPPEGIATAAEPTFPVGTDVVLIADHMPGMDGATATIDSSTQEPAYMVDVHSEEMTMTNHKWVTESEVRPAP